ncbi:MAG: trypsin-like peptidase domain-containing protein [Patescibacteria group bacterium]
MDSLEQQTIQTVKKVAPAVVSIVISKMMPQVQKLSLTPEFKPVEHFPLPLTELPLPDGGEKQKVKVGGGSGFVVSPDGLILTNKHVVYETDAEYTVVMSDEKEYQAKVLTRDPINDVAMLKIEAKDLPTATLGNSDKVELGQTAIAIGNALGLFSNTVSKGIISGLGRKISAALGQGGMIENLRHVIQTDVAINQGNSGGPLVNLDGEVIGINTAIIFGAQNIGFALPINWAKTDLEELAKYGRIIRPYIGLRYIMLNKELQEKYNLTVDYGALVIKDHLPGSEAVVKDSPADKGGLKENDIVLEINGIQLTEKNELADVVEAAKVGDKLTLYVLRGGEKITTQIKLEERH